MAIAREGYFLVAVATALALCAFVVAAILDSRLVWVLAYLFVILALSAAFLFRDPARRGERGPHLILAPADGRVVTVADVEDPSYLRGAAKRISILLRLFDVHVQRSPVAGRIDHRSVVAGRARAAARRLRAKEREPVPEEVALGIDAGTFRVLVRFIAAGGRKRLVTYVDEGDHVRQGDRIGTSRFASRVDTLVPPHTRLKVKPGDRVYAGRTVVGELPGDA